MPRKKQNPYGLTSMELAIVRQALNQTEDAWKIGLTTLVQLDAAGMKLAQARKLELLRDARAKIFPKVKAPTKNELSPHLNLSSPHPEKMITLSTAYYERKS